MKKTLLLFSTILFSIALSAQDNIAAIAKKDGQWGMIKKDGSWLIEPHYTGIQDFVDGRALAKKGDLWGVIDNTGKWLIEPNFNRIRKFEDGYAMAEKAGEWMVIDTEGNTVFKQGDYKRIDWLHNGIIIAYEKKVMKYVDVSNGSVLPTPTESKKLFPFSEGLARYQKDGMWGFIDNTGAFKIRPQFEDVNNFKDGKCKVRKGGLWGVIDKEGNFLIPCEFEDLHNFQLHFSGDNADLSMQKKTLAKKGGKWGIIDESGKWILEPKYTKLKPLREGLALATMNDKQGYVKEDGSWMDGPAGAEKMWEFNDGVAMFRKEGLIGYMDKEGDVIVQPKYNKGFEWSGPTGRVLKEDQWYYVDKTGAEYPINGATKLYPYHGDLACVKIGKVYGYVDAQGKTVIGADYTNVEDEFLHNKTSGAGLGLLKKSSYEEPNRDKYGFIIVRKGEKFGTIDKTGKVIIPIELDDLKNFYPY